MARYWVIAPYESRYADVFEKAWDYDLKKGTIAVGWTTLGDISELDKDELRQEIADTYPGRTERSYTIDCNALWRFYHEIGVGDKIIARRGRMRMVGVGVVTGSAFYDEKKGRERVGNLTDVYYPNLISVDWEERSIEFDYLAFGMNTLTGPFNEDYYQDLVEGEGPEGGEEEVVEPTSFPLESHLEEFIVTNFDNIFGGSYELYEDPEGVVGRQYPVTNETGKTIGRIDILARERNTNSFLVIELKRDTGTHDAVGQILWYIGWVRTNLCERDEDVKGLIICTDKDERLDYALELVRDLVDVKLYSMSFQLHGSLSQ